VSAAGAPEPRPGGGADSTPRHQPPEAAGHPSGESAEPDPAGPAPASQALAGPPKRWSRLGAGIAAVLVAAGTGAGVLIGHAAWPASGGGSSLGPTSSVSSGETGAAAVASKVSAGLVDINVTLGYQQARAAGTGMVLTSNGEVLTNNHVIEGATSISVTDRQRQDVQRERGRLRPQPRRRGAAAGRRVRVDLRAGRGGVGPDGVSAQPAGRVAGRDRPGLAALIAI